MLLSTIQVSLYSHAFFYKLLNKTHIKNIITQLIDISNISNEDISDSKILLYPFLEQTSKDKGKSGINDFT